MYLELPSNPSPQKSPLLHLPTELRLQIYSHLPSPPTTLSFAWHDQRPPSIPLTRSSESSKSNIWPLRAICSLIRLEILPLYASATHVWTSIIWDDSKYTQSLLVRKCQSLQGQILDVALMRDLSISEWHLDGGKVRRTRAQLREVGELWPKVRCLLGVLVSRMPKLGTLVVELAVYRDSMAVGRMKDDVRALMLAVRDQCQNGRGLRLRLGWKIVVLGLVDGEDDGDEDLVSCRAVLEPGAEFVGMHSVCQGCRWVNVLEGRSCSHLRDVAALNA